MENKTPISKFEIIFMATIIYFILAFLGVWYLPDVYELGGLSWRVNSRESVAIGVALSLTMGVMFSYIVFEVVRTTSSKAEMIRYFYIWAISCPVIFLLGYYFAVAMLDKAYPDITSQNAWIYIFLIAFGSIILTVIIVSVLKGTLLHKHLDNPSKSGEKTSGYRK